jgi:hypothetical protein
MSNCEHEDENEYEDTLTFEEQDKIITVQSETLDIEEFKKQVELQEQEQEQEQEASKSFSIWSIFSFFSNPKPALDNLNDIITTQAVKQTHKNIAFNVKKVLYLEKSVIINNISGRDAYLILTPAPITTLSSLVVGIGFAGIEASVDASLDTKGEYKVQKVSITNNTSSRYELDNNKFYCTLYINDGNQWKKSWDNRKFNGRNYDINILEKHVAAALKDGSIPDF